MKLSRFTTPSRVINIAQRHRGQSLYYYHYLNRELERKDGDICFPRVFVRNVI